MPDLRHGCHSVRQIHPFVVDANGRVYCREHGATVDPTYGEALERYRKMREARDRVLAYLQEGGQKATEEEVNQVLAELGG